MISLVLAIVSFSIFCLGLVLAATRVTKVTADGDDVALTIVVLTAFLVFTAVTYGLYIEQRTYDRLYYTKSTIELRGVDWFGIRFYKLVPQGEALEKTAVDVE